MEVHVAWSALILYATCKSMPHGDHRPSHQVVVVVVVVVVDVVLVLVLLLVLVLMLVLVLVLVAANHRFGAMVRLNVAEP